MFIKYFLILSTSIIGIYGFLEETKKKRFKPLFIGLLLILAIVQVIKGCGEDRKNKYDRISGKLVSDIKRRDDLPTLSLCDAHLVWHGQEGKPIFQLGDDFITVRMKDGKALFSMIIRDNSGDVILNIVENEWIVSREKVFDWNFTDNTLEIIDKKNDVLFQVQLKGNDVRLAGKTYFKDGKGPVEFGPLLTTCDYGVKGTIFLYSREQHPGEKKKYIAN